MPVTPVRSIVKELENRGPMFVQPHNYDTVVAYLSGFNHAAVASGESDELDSFRNWLNKQLGYHCCNHWSVVIRDVFCKGDKEKSLRQLFKLFGEFEGSQRSSAARRSENGVAAEKPPKRMAPARGISRKKNQSA